MVLQPKRDYKTDILKILELNETITGFNNLKRMGKFHSNRLQVHLDKLEKNGDISTDKSHREYVYSYIQPKTEEKYNEFRKELSEIERSLKNPDLKPDEKILLLSNFFTLSFYYLNLFRILNLMHDEIGLTTDQKYKTMKKFQEKLYGDIKSKLNNLSNHEKTRVLNILLSKYQEKPYLMTLSAYREYTHIPTMQEKKEQRLAMEQYMQKEYEKGGTKCFICNEKLPQHYKDGHKHIEQHLIDMPKTIKQLKNKK